MSVIFAPKEMSNEDFEALIAANENDEAPLGSYENAFYEALSKIFVKNKRIKPKQIGNLGDDILDDAYPELISERHRLVRVKLLRQLEKESKKVHAGIIEITRIIHESGIEGKEACAFTGLFGLIQNKCSLQNVSIYFEQNNKRMAEILDGQTLKPGRQTSPLLNCATMIACSFYNNISPKIWSGNGRRDAHTDEIEESEFDKVCNIVRQFLSIDIAPSTRDSAARIAKETRGGAIKLKSKNNSPNLRE